MTAQHTSFEFHISREARDRYEFDEGLFGITANVIFINIEAVRDFAFRMNQRRDLRSFPDQAIKSGDLYAMGLIDEILHLVVGMYREQVRPTVMAEALAWLESNVGREILAPILHAFAARFPTVAVYRNGMDVPTYLAGTTGGIPNRHVVLEELVLLYLANENPAFSPFEELFDDEPLRQADAYPALFGPLRAFFDTVPRFGPDNENLFDLLRAPALASPDSLEGQITFILERWAPFLGNILGERLRGLLHGLDLIREERKLPFLGPGETVVDDYSDLSMRGREGRSMLAGAAFSPDLDWMPSIVLMAKNVYVWMDQLSRRYNRDIYRLDQIPDEELAQLGRWGFTGLWLIGVWERSPASQRIKQLCGNPEAVPSAYSLHDYTIANDLGGQAAYDNLHDRAWAHGLRMATDMVPNHVGITSRWMVEHPDWFISVDQNPYPWYTYGGPDFSLDERVGVFIEDHYYDRTDAAVVFKRVDRWTGSEKFVYHGNDGTTMPWNDTAQLNYLNPEVREAVIQTILSVARQFPVIRFDAAMTLTKQHYQRLWFPEPGTGGAIPTRSEHGLTLDQFDAAMPHEFWREVVDRVAAEAPDTLLLAEAFWLLEGYFVRTLGMHRVYNSAFMNMLRDEENAKYRQVIKNTIEFDSEILRRFVNFMNNPDERTAVDQFGKDDKYIGVCTLMVTMPGLPMFGHGQVEGLTEKYGMEYRRAYWDETPDGHLIARHEREVFPLMARRRLFAGVEQFRLYDFFTASGSVDENVFAYSNELGGERAVVVYHNRYGDTAGWIRMSAGFAVKTGNGDETTLAQVSLADALGLQCGQGWFSIFRDETSGLEYLRSNDQLGDEGLYVEMGAYQRHVFVDFRQVEDTSAQRYGELAGILGGRPVPSVAEALRDLHLQPVREAFRAVVSPDLLRPLLAKPIPGSQAEPAPALEEPLRRLFEEARKLTGNDAGEGATVEETLDRIAALRSAGTEPIPAGPAEEAASAYLSEPAGRAALLGWALASTIGSPAEASGAHALRGWRLAPILGEAYQQLGLDPLAAALAVDIAGVLLGHDGCIAAALAGDGQAILVSLFSDAQAANVLGVNRADGVLWFNKERYEAVLAALSAAATIVSLTATESVGSARADRLQRLWETGEALRAGGEASGWRVERLLAAPSPGPGMSVDSLESPGLR